jgi:hypothetical protein
MTQTIAAELPAQMTLPLFQPLRYWTPRSVAPRNAIGDRSRPSILSMKGFSMKGGFHLIGGERRMVIAGKIVKNEAAVRA